jgi:hypothetical protein
MSSDTITVGLGAGLGIGRATTGAGASGAGAAGRVWRPGVATGVAGAVVTGGATGQGAVGAGAGAANGPTSGEGHESAAGTSATIRPSGVSAYPKRESFTYPARARTRSMTAMTSKHCTTRARPHRDDLPLRPR